MKEGAVYPDYIGVSEVTTRSAEQMRVEGCFEGQPSIMFDEPEGFDIGDPPELRGRSRGWTPVHAQLAALAACTSITIAVVARDQGFRIEDDVLVTPDGCEVLSDLPKSLDAVSL